MINNAKKMILIVKVYYWVFNKQDFSVSKWNQLGSSSPAQVATLQSHTNNELHAIIIIMLLFCCLNNQPATSANLPF